MRFEFSLDDSMKQLDKYWELCIGSCHAATALREDYRRQLARCQRELGFRYVRFHGLFDDDMSVLRYDEFSKEYMLSFTNIDSIFDFLLSINMKPFIELGFMPECLRSNDNTVFHYKGYISPPSSMDTWAWLVEKFTEHVVERYGLDEVRQWFFEVWNEPNLGGPDVTTGFWSGTMEDYFDLYRASALAIKGVDKGLAVGGPATSNNAWIPETLEFCARTNTPIDFVSTHHYPTDVILGYGVEDSKIAIHPPVDMGDPEALAAFMEDPEAKEKLEAFRNGLWTEVDRGVVTEMTRKAVQEAKGLPVYYTEWNSLAGLPSDGPFGASFIAKTVLDGVGLAKGYSYWTFTDIFEEGGMPSAEFHGGFGLLTLHGVPKASYRAFELLHKLGEEIGDTVGREGTVDAYFFRKRASNAVQVLCVNHHSLLHDIRAEKVTLALRGLPDGAIKGDLLRLDDTHANAMAKWEALGGPEYPSPAQMHQLMAASMLEREALTAQAQNGSLEFTLEIPPMGMALVTFYL